MMALAPPKSDKPVIPPLSTSLPKEYEQLPLFGRIEWTVTQMPWVSAGPYEGISGIGMVELDGMIYVMGGFIPGGDGSESAGSPYHRHTRTSRWCRRYDPATDRWSELPDLPVRREYGRAMVADGKIYFLGGTRQMDAGYIKPSRIYGDMFVLDPNAAVPRWEWHSQLTVPRSHMAVAGIGSYLTVIGGNEFEWASKGYHHDTIRETVEVFDLNNPDAGWRICTPIPDHGRGWSASVVHEERLYLFGGLSWAEEGTMIRSAQTLSYSPKTNEWTSASPAPVAVSGWEGAVHDGRYAIIGGGVADVDGTATIHAGWSDLVWVFDLAENRWLRMDPPIPTGGVCNDIGVVILGDVIYIIGGEGPYGSHYNYMLKGKIRSNG